MSTKRLTTRLRDPKEWDVVLDDVPIFVEHTMYELPTGEHLALLPTKTPPQGAVAKYVVDKARLAAISKQINEDLDRHDCPIKLRDGHTKHGEPQANQPPIVGYGGRTKVAEWNGISAITTPLHYEKGYGKLANERPERSPEYRWLKNSIPDVALLATEPRLKMGHTHLYAAADEIMRYAVGMEAIVDPSDPTTQNTSAALRPEDQKTADLIWDYLCQAKPQMEWLCSQFKDVRRGPTEEGLPPAPGVVPPLAPPGGIPTGGADSQPYEDSAMTPQEADALRAELEAAKTKLAEHEKKEAEAAQKYADADSNRHIDLLSTHYEFPAGARERVFGKMRITDDAGRVDISNEIKSCWKPKANAATAPVGGLVKGLDPSPTTENYQDEDPPIDVMLQVASEKGLNFSNDYRQVSLLSRERMKAARK